MLFLADENMPGPAVALLRAAGVEVSWVREDAPGLPDDAVLAYAAELLTFDKDFGELAIKAEMTSTFGVILFRLPTSRPHELALRVANLVLSLSDWLGSFALVTPRQIRMRPLTGR